MPDELNEPTPEPQDSTPTAHEPVETMPDVEVTPPAFDLLTNSANPPSNRDILTETKDD